MSEKASKQWEFFFRVVQTVTVAALLGSFTALIDLGKTAERHDERIHHLENSETHEWLRADVNEIKLTVRSLDARMRELETKPR